MVERSDTTGNPRNMTDPGGIVQLAGTSWYDPAGVVSSGSHTGGGNHFAVLPPARIVAFLRNAEELTRPAAGTAAAT